LIAIDPFDLHGKVCLVTGGNRGLGLGFATGIAKAGGDVVIWARDKARNAVAVDLLRQYGGGVLAQSVDVSDRSQVQAATAAALDATGRIDGVVVCAGMNTRPAAFHTMPVTTYHELLNVNLHGATYTLQSALAHMVERAEAGDSGGSVVTCGSLTVARGVSRLEHYAAAKGALASMTYALAVDYGRYGIRANMVAPGYFESELGGRDQDVVTMRAEQMRTRNPIPRAGTPADVEGIIVYLMSDASAYHTGDVIVIDGGMSVVL
jgi:NAD(P)-dependent dehydrogenase (short-subunit alcohol dehydrogenase family)